MHTHRQLDRLPDRQLCAREENCPISKIIPAGASELEFLNPERTSIREQLGIGKEDFVYLSVGAPAYNKGHKEILQAYLLLEVPFASTLVLNGNYDSEANLAALAQDPRERIEENRAARSGASPSNIGADGCRKTKITAGVRRLFLPTSIRRESCLAVLRRRSVPFCVSCRILAARDLRVHGVRFALPFDSGRQRG